VQSPRGTGKIARIDGVELAGKTGTAQVVRLPEEKQEDEEIPYHYRDHAWFVAFAPYDNPKISVAVLIEHGGFGSSAAGPVAREIIKSYLSNIGCLKKEVSSID
jgi:penicillin-binding protein 2